MSKGNRTVSVVYIMGDGRSGSTALAIVLGNHPEVESVGELPGWPLFRGHPKKGNEKTEDHDFWSSVRDCYSSQGGPADFAGLIEVQDQIEDYRNFPKLLCRRISPRVVTKYREHVHRLLEAIRHASGKDIVVDSGKKPGRAYMLLGSDNLHVRIIHLVRDPRAVLWSQMKRDVEQKHKAPHVAMIHYSIKNFMSEAVRLLAPNHAILRVRYEDLVRRPAHELARIGGLLNLSMDPIVLKLEADQPFNVPHLLDGNRIRRERAIKLKRDDEWRERLSLRQRLLSVLLTFPFFVAYGYWDYAYDQD